MKPSQQYLMALASAVNAMTGQSPERVHQLCKEARWHLMRLQFDAEARMGIAQLERDGRVIESVMEVGR